MDYIRYYEDTAAYYTDQTRLTPSLSYIASTGETITEGGSVARLCYTVDPEDFTDTEMGKIDRYVTTATVPNGVTSVGDDAFRGCWLLESVTLPHSLREIGDNAFLACGTLQSIDIPSRVSVIGENAFKGSTALENLTVRNTIPPELGTDALLNTPANMVIYVPSDRVNAYKAATGWSDYASQIEAIPEPTPGPTPPTPSYPTDTIYYDANGTVVGTDSSAVLSGPPSGMLTEDVTRIVFGNVVTSIAQEAFDVSIDGSLDEIELGENITSIGEMAFFGEDTITKVTIHATTPPTIGPDLFGSTAYYPAQPFAIYVPAESVSAYQTAWSEYSQYITAIQ